MFSVVKRDAACALGMQIDDSISLSLALLLHLLALREKIRHDSRLDV